jgi:hypothetical protein
MTVTASTLLSFENHVFETGVFEIKKKRLQSSQSTNHSRERLCPPATYEEPSWTCPRVRGGAGGIEPGVVTTQGTGYDKVWKVGGRRWHLSLQGRIQLVLDGTQGTQEGVWTFALLCSYLRT